MEPFPPDLDKTLCGMPEDLRFEDGTPVYNEDGVDLSHIRSCLAETPAERLQCIQAVARIGPRANGTRLFDPLEILRALARHSVDFILVGGLADAVQGSPLNTVDVDVVYSGEGANTLRLRTALQDLNASYRSERDKHIQPITTFPQVPRQLVNTKYGCFDAFGANCDEFTDLASNAQSLELAAGLLIKTLSLEECVRRREQLNREKDRAALPDRRRLAKAGPDKGPIQD